MNVSDMSVNEDIHFKLLRMLEDKPSMTQRELADDLGVSLGKTNYCLKALVEKGWLKASNFKNNKNKLSYSYLLTPSGVEQKARITVRFLKRKMGEYESLKEEIEQLKKEVSKSVEITP